MSDKARQTALKLSPKYLTSPLSELMSGVIEELENLHLRIKKLEADKIAEMTEAESNRQKSCEVQKHIVEGNQEMDSTTYGCEYDQHRGFRTLSSDEAK